MTGLLPLFAMGGDNLKQFLGVPLPPVRPPEFSAPPPVAPVTAPTVAPAVAPTAAPSPSASGFSFDKLADAMGSIYGKGGPGDPLIALGMGLLAHGTNGRGFAAGLQNMQQGAILKSHNDLLQQRVAKEQAALQGRMAYAKQLDPSLTSEGAAAVASSDGLFNDLWRRAHPAENYSQETDAKGNVWNVNKMTGQRTVALAAPVLSPQLVDVPLPDGNMQKQWVTPGQGGGGAMGSAVGAPHPAPGAPTIERDAAARERLMRASGMDPNDPRNAQFKLTGKFPREDAQPLTATDKKAILEADEGVSAAQNAVDAFRRAKKLSPGAMGGPGAGLRSTIGANLPDWMVPDAVASPGQSVATQELDNLVTSNALSQLKAIFGGNPTEGERAIMLDIQGSSSKPDDVRQKIYDRAIEMAQRRLEFNRQRAQELRGGDYYRPGGAPQQPQPSPEPQAKAKRYRYDASGNLVEQ